MNNELETIENYLTGQLSADERTRFEATLRSDPAVAESLAFYVMATHTAKAHARSQRKAELDALYKTLPKATARSAWGAPMRWVAAASVVLVLGLGWYFLRDTSTPTDAAQLAEAYVEQNFDQLTTTMSGGVTDSLTQGIGLYNEKKFAEAESVFESVLVRQPNNDRALKLAGVVALRQKNYDLAIDRFHRLSQRTDLYSNPGTFLEAIALLERNRPMDKAAAKKLLEQVINKNLDGTKEANDLLKAL
jgi:tetratricopeptide (TPR) repeat protein